MAEFENLDEGAAIGRSGAKKRKPSRKRRAKSRKLPPFNVILLNDEEHTDEYVVEMLGKVFAMPLEAGGGLVKALDSAGRAIVMTTHKELAELKREQIEEFGADWRLPQSKGPMAAVVEPAEEKEEGKKRG
jgi:ATP-dependent Clp protease adaptor protein ClpS